MCACMQVVASLTAVVATASEAGTLSMVSRELAVCDTRRQWQQWQWQGYIT